MPWLETCDPKLFLAEPALGRRKTPGLRYGSEYRLKISIRNSDFKSLSTPGKARSKRASRSLHLLQFFLSGLSLGCSVKFFHNPRVDDTSHCGFAHLLPSHCLLEKGAGGFTPFRVFVYHLLESFNRFLIVLFQKVALTDVIQSTFFQAGFRKLRDESLKLFSGSFIFLLLHQVDTSVKFRLFGVFSLSVRGRRRGSGSGRSLGSRRCQRYGGLRLRPGRLRGWRRFFRHNGSGRSHRGLRRLRLGSGSLGALELIEFVLQLFDPAVQCPHLHLHLFHPRVQVPAFSRCSFGALKA